MSDEGSFVPHRRRLAFRAILASLPLFLLGSLLVGPGAAVAGVVFGPDLVVTMTDDPDPVAPGEAVTFTVLVANNGPADSYDTELAFNTEGVSVDSAILTGGEGGECSIEASSASCSLGYLPTLYSSGEAVAPALASNEREVVIVATAPNDPGSSFDSEATTSSGEQADENPADNTVIETTQVSEGTGGSDSGILPPGGSLSTVTGTNRDPVNAEDPFAIALTNVSNQTFDGFIEEEPCDGSQEGPLCSVARVGGVAGNFEFQSVAPERFARHGGASAVMIAKLFYDRTIVQGVRGFKIFYQKDSSSPVIKLPRCRRVRTSECFVSARRRGTGDQIVRVKLSTDPRVTRG